MDKELELVEHKASILIDALPYIRDFNQKTVVIEYGCAEWLSGVEEQRLMQDIVLLKSVGMRPIVVHATRMGLDKFRENKQDCQGLLDSVESRQSVSAAWIQRRLV